MAELRFVNTANVSACREALMCAPSANEGILQFKTKHPNSESRVSDFLAGLCCLLPYKSYSAAAEAVLGNA